MIKEIVKAFVALTSLTVVGAANLKAGDATPAFYIGSGSTMKFRYDLQYSPSVQCLNAPVNYSVNPSVFASEKSSTTDMIAFAKHIIGNRLPFLAIGNSGDPSKLINIPAGTEFKVTRHVHVDNMIPWVSRVGGCASEYDGNRLTFKNGDSGETWDLVTDQGEKLTMHLAWYVIPGRDQDNIDFYLYPERLTPLKKAVRNYILFDAQWDCRAGVQDACAKYWGYLKDEREYKSRVSQSFNPVIGELDHLVYDLTIF